MAIREDPENGEIKALHETVGTFSGKRVLEIGCGTGGFLIAARQKYEHVVGMGVAFRWLIIAKKRLSELGLHVPLILSDQSFTFLFRFSMFLPLPIRKRLRRSRSARE